MKSRIRVLIVADHFRVAQGMCLAMASHGHDVAVANDAVSAANLASASEPDFVVLDLEKPANVGLHLRGLLGPHPVLIATRGMPKAGVDLHLVEADSEKLNGLLTRLHRWDERPACRRWCSVATKTA